jgi:hypothetical protein
MLRHGVGVLVRYGQMSIVTQLPRMTTNRREIKKSRRMEVEIEPYFAEEARKRQGTRTDLKENVPTSSDKRRPAVQSRDQAAAIRHGVEENLPIVKTVTSRGWCHGLGRTSSVIDGVIRHGQARAL